MARPNPAVTTRLFELISFASLGILIVALGPTCRAAAVVYNDGTVLDERLRGWRANQQRLKPELTRGCFESEPCGVGLCLIGEPTVEN